MYLRTVEKVSDTRPSSSNLYITEIFNLFLNDFEERIFSSPSAEHMVMGDKFAIFDSY